MGPTAAAVASNNIARGVMKQLNIENNSLRKIWPLQWMSMPAPLHIGQRSYLIYIKSNLGQMKVLTNSNSYVSLASGLKHRRGQRNGVSSLPKYAEQ